MKTITRSWTFTLLLIGVMLPGMVTAQWGLQSTRLKGEPDARDLRTLLKDLELMHEVFFSYDAATLEGKSTRLDVDRSLQLEENLNRILRSAGLRFERVSPQVYAILAEEEEFKSSEVVRSADKLPEDREAVQNLIIGIVTNGTDPLPGASVRIKNSLKGTATDTEGNFELAVDEPEVVLIVSFLGYLSQEVTVKVGETITIALMPDLEAIEEVDEA